jgi:uncharacterized protein (TIGR03435 family)
MEQRSAQVLQRLRLEKEWTSKRTGGASDSAYPAIDPVRRIRRWQWPAVAAALAATVMAVMLPTRILQGVPAVLEDAEGRRSIEYDELVRPAGDRSAMLSMRDGSRVETRSMSEFSLERMDDGGTRIRLKEGGLIVDASAKNRANLYVQTKDMTALVSGAVSLVKAEEEGSRIAAIGGEIRVQQGATEKKLTPGQQVASNPKMEPIPVKEELAWSRQAAEHVAMLEQAQSSLSGSPAPAARPKFATASVRPVPLSPRIVNGLKCLGVDGLLWETPDMGVQVLPRSLQDGGARRGRCSGQVVDLRELVHGAYGTLKLEAPMQRMLGFPDPPFPMYYQIEAVADDPEHVTKGELKLMLQTLLEDRFKARVHLEAREVDGYVLTIAKSGVKFKETSVDTKAAVTPSPCLYNGYANRQEIYVRGKCGMEELTSYLSRLLMLPVADKTGLMGIYNIDFVLEAAFLAPTGGGPPRGAGGQQARQFTTPVPKALEEQLGLQVERGKAPAEFVVVDHIEQPTEN